MPTSKPKHLTRREFLKLSGVILLCMVLAACGVAPTPTLLPTATAFPTVTPIPTPTSTPKPTTMPTGDPKGVTERIQKEQNYKITVKSTTVGPDGITYAVYLLTRPVPTATPSFFSPPQNCSLLFYYWDGYEYQLIDSFQVTRSACYAVPWEIENTPAEEKTILKLDGFWSDINGNGLPEFFIIYQDFCNSAIGNRNNCIDYMYYEIQNTKRIVLLNNGMQGKILPNHILYQSSPRSIYVFKYDEYVFRGGTVVDLIYTWDGTKFVNTSEEHPENFRRQIDETISNIKQAFYGKPLKYEPWSFLEILAVYNYSSLSQEEILATFMEVTNPINYPGTQPMPLCLLQVARAQALMDFENKKNKFQIEFNYLPQGPDVANWAKRFVKYDMAKYDISACKSLTQ